MISENSRIITDHLRSNKEKIIVKRKYVKPMK